MFLNLESGILHVRCGPAARGDSRVARPLHLATQRLPSVSGLAEKMRYSQARGGGRDHSAHRRLYKDSFSPRLAIGATSLVRRVSPTSADSGDNERYRRTCQAGLADDPLLLQELEDNCANAAGEFSGGELPCPRRQMLAQNYL